MKTEIELRREGADLFFKHGATETKGNPYSILVFLGGFLAVGINELNDGKSFIIKIEEKK